MAIITFGSTARSNNAVALKNTSTSTQIFALLHGASIASGAYKYMTLADLDARMRGTNLRNNTLYTVDSDGVKPYLDDIAEFCKLVTNGTIQVFTATQTVSANTISFTLGTALATAGAFLGDGSVVFS